MDADRDSELDTIVERLLAVQELCAETRRLESKDRDISATDVTIPSSWLPLLSEGLEVAIEVAEEGSPFLSMRDVVGSSPADFFDRLACLNGESVIDHRADRGGPVSKDSGH